MNPIDIIVLLLLVLGLFSGARAGFFGPTLGLAGAVVGFAFALFLATVLREPLGQIEQPLRAIVTLAALAAFVLVGEALGGAIGANLSLGLRQSLFQPFDAIGGAVVGAAHVILFVWLAGGMLASGMAPWLGPAVRDSVAIQLTDALLPAPLTVAGRLLSMLDTTDLPPLFGGLEPPPAEPVDLPADAQTRALAESATASTGKITAAGCGAGLSVGSGFFVSATHVVTNAHVVAGSTEATVTLGANVYEAQVVAFDPAADLALLYAPGASAPALRLDPSSPARGTPGAILGYPGGGDLTVSGAGVTATYEIGGPDIYGAGRHERTVVELRAGIRQGNSGGPLVVAPGTVGAVVFGASRLSPEIGYAIGADEAVERIGPFVGSTAPVDTGACL